METELLILGIAIFGASTLQSATGIGFGVIAGPVLLAILNDGTAIQISVVLNLLIAVVLAPSLWRLSNKLLLKSMLGGLIVGSPIGLLLYLYIDIAMLKILASAGVLFTLLMVVRGMRAAAPSSNGSMSNNERISMGLIAGLMGGSLAMPGPVPAAWMSARGFDKDTIRATLLVMFVAAYTIALILQLTLTEISSDTLKLTANLTLPTIAGLPLGHVLASRVSELAFRLLLIAMLAFTALFLLASLVQP